ncbi:expressed hypothetical protein [Trichoplax adhaerens]|uniref:40S ribosomal protein S8 n=1 Tax=Trichoplax adhaerens TaxID=10228 RepID=B3SA16_TRIAD|nr:expressed hypothetical protein [Trichoplax adhaerens]EDV20362.1 expressed hypothetical protein [Trichoplax adhaerens]|eukprot:XP_002117056.1 expressed hypothetical protein [Trichoplax adhaerens]
MINAGISRDSWHKRRSTSGRKAPLRKKRKFELGRQPAMTKMGAKRIHTVRTRGGNYKYRALRLETGNYSWASEAISRKSRILDVVYNASNNELVRTKTLVKNCIVQIDATPFKQWYESHYNIPIVRKKSKQQQTTEETEEIRRSKRVEKKLEARKRFAKIASALEEQFGTGRIYACVASRPGQCGRCDGYILEGKELEFYLKKIRSKKTK